MTMLADDPRTDLCAAALASRAVRHPFLERIGRGDLTPHAMAHVLGGYLVYSRRFPEVIEAAMAWWSCDAAVFECLRSVFEDEGDAREEGEPHFLSLERCAASLNEPLSERDLTPFESACAHYALALLDTVKSEPLAALGAIGPGTEAIVPSLYRPFVRWFDLHPELGADYAFFRDHLVMDEGHAALVDRAISAALRNPKDWARVEVGLKRTLKDRALLWDRLEVAVALLD